MFDYAFYVFQFSCMKIHFLNHIFSNVNSVIQPEITFLSYFFPIKTGQSGEGEPVAPSDGDNALDEEDSPYENIPDAESGDFVLTEHNYAIPPETATNNNPNETGIKIKLKYINDDLKLVDCRLEETVGEFKRRNFSVELNSNKIVRLIFNGRVLQPDDKSLQNCGLFDNCVVHCLIHNKRPSVVDGGGGGATQNADDFMRGNNNNNRQRVPHMNNNNNQGRESDLGNILFALISFILVSAWYFR